MRKEIVETGKNVESAIETACEKLGCGREDCEWEIMELPKKSFLGLKTTPAKVKVWIDVEEEQPQQKPAPVREQQNRRREPTPQRKDKPATMNSMKSEPPKQPEPVKQQEIPLDAAVGDKVETTKQYVASILEAMGLNATLHVSMEDGGACINVEGQGLGMIIGRRGETLDAIQYLSSLVANRLEGEYLRITIDCGDYRAKRKQTLEALARKLASQVLKTNVSKTLEPMNPFERRIIHATVSEIEGVSSLSIGEEPNRRVVITSPTARSRGGNRRGREQGRDSRSGGDRRPPRGPRRDDRADRRRSPAPRSAGAPTEQGPPKQTPEAKTENPLYAKIDLE